MIARGAPDISWTDLIAAAAFCIAPGDAADAQRQVESMWRLAGGESSICRADQVLALLSVRSGVDALLQALAWPAGSEIIISAITIPHMLDIFRRHRLVTVPVDINTHTLAIDSEEVCRAVTPRTRAVFVAHLFGSRMPLDAVALVAERHDLQFRSDQAANRDGWRRVPVSRPEAGLAGPRHPGGISVPITLGIRAACTVDDDGKGHRVAVPVQHLRRGLPLERARPRSANRRGRTVVLRLGFIFQASAAAVRASPQDSRPPAAATPSPDGRAPCGDGRRDDP